MIQLLPHQQAFVDKNPRKAILAWGTRVGKSYTIAFWLKHYTLYNFLLVCPKRLVKKWQEDLQACGDEHSPNVTICTKEQFKKIDLTKYDGIVVDEAHHFNSPLKIKPSQLTVSLYNWACMNPNAPVLLATATPISSSPANLHTLAAIVGHTWDWGLYQREFYQLVRRPFSPRPFFEPRPNWRKNIRPYVREVCDILTLSDVVEVPEQQHETIPIALMPDTQKKVNDFHDVQPSKEWAVKHQLENGMEKLLKIRDLSEDESKVIIVCKYRHQQDMYAKELAKDREVFVLNGDTKDPGAVIKEAQESTECYFIAQADCMEGFRGDSFSMLIFASMSWRYVSYEQTLGRMLHLDKKNGNKYYYLLSGEKDRSVYDRIMAGKDFSIERATITN